MPGNRVQAVGGIAQHHQMRTYLLLGFDQRQGVQVPCADLAQQAQTVAEHFLQLAEEAAFIQFGQAFGVHPGTGPDQRTAVFRQGQQGHRAFVGEALERLTTVSFARSDVGNQRALVVRALADMDAQLFAQAGAAAVGEHRQVALNLGIVIERQAITVFQRLHGSHFSRATPAHHLGIQAFPQALPQPGVFHYITQSGNPFLQRIQARGAKAATVGNLDLANRFGPAADLLPQAQTLIDLPGAEGQRRGACVIARLVAVARCEGFDQQDLPAARLGARLQGKRQTGADQATANDCQVHPVHAAALRAAAIKASISATVFGTPEVRISQPCLVTTTSSSIRTPMPRHFFATFWLSAPI
ncbi:hypothetical protein D9M71_218850 [compost metagenome]